MFPNLLFLGGVVLSCCYACYICVVYFDRSCLDCSFSKRRCCRRTYREKHDCQYSSSIRRSRVALDVLTISDYQKDSYSWTCPCCQFLVSNVCSVLFKLSSITSWCCSHLRALATHIITFHVLSFCFDLKFRHYLLIFFLFHLLSSIFLFFFNLSFSSCSSYCLRLLLIWYPLKMSFLSAFETRFCAFLVIRQLRLQFSILIFQNKFHSWNRRCKTEREVAQVMECLREQCSRKSWRSLMFQ